LEVRVHVGLREGNSNPHTTGTRNGAEVVLAWGARARGGEVGFSVGGEVVIQRMRLSRCLVKPSPNIIVGEGRRRKRDRPATTRRGKISPVSGNHLKRKRRKRRGQKKINWVPTLDGQTERET